jgi:TPR repeat protein
MGYTTVRALARLSLSLLLLSVPGLAAAETTPPPFSEGVVAYQRGDYRTAVSIFRSLADRGDAAVQFILGVQYAAGRGVAQDYAEAARWYRRAADQGDAAAQGDLGTLYANGQGVGLDYAEAVRWWIKADDARALLAK